VPLKAGKPRDESKKLFVFLPEFTIDEVNAIDKGDTYSHKKQDVQEVKIKISQK
jgi:hypothetical protein